MTAAVTNAASTKELILLIIGMEGVVDIMARLE